MSVYRRGGTLWFKFRFAGKIIRESAKTRSLPIARRAARERRKQVELGYNNLLDEDRSQRVQTLNEAAESYEKSYAARNTPNAAQYFHYCVKHLVEHLGREASC
jgi:hypothetical protein